MPAIYLNYDLPAEIASEEEAVAYVSDIAKDSKCMAWLNLARRESVFIDGGGKLTCIYRHGLKGSLLPYKKVR